MAIWSWLHISHMLKMQRQQLPLWSPRLYSDFYMALEKKNALGMRFDHDHDKRFRNSGKLLFASFGYFGADIVFHCKSQSTSDPATILFAMRIQQLHGGLQQSSDSTKVKNFVNRCKEKKLNGILLSPCAYQHCRDLHLNVSAVSLTTEELDILVGAVD